MSNLRNPHSPFDAALSEALITNVYAALTEDVGGGDWTAKLVPLDAYKKAEVVVREAAVLCGAPWFDAVMQAVDASIQIDWKYAEGDLMQADTVVCQIEGPAQSLLTAERCALSSAISAACWSSII